MERRASLSTSSDTGTSIAAYHLRVLSKWSYPTSGWWAREYSRKMILVLKANQELDFQCPSQAEAPGLEVDNLALADIVYPLVTQRVMDVFQKQLIHICNGCISDDPNKLSYVWLANPALGALNRLIRQSFNINFQEEALSEKRPCPVCRQLQTVPPVTKHRTARSIMF